MRDRFELIQRRSHIEETLAEHADALLHDERAAGQLARAYSATEPGLGGLLQLAHAVKQALVPVDPKAAYVAGLRAQLTSAAGSITEEHSADQPRVLMRIRRVPPAVVIAAITSVVGSALAVIAILSHRRRSTARNPMTAV